MNQVVAGITLERNRTGIPVYARINLSKYGEMLKPFFNEIGLDYQNEEIPNSKTESAINEAKNYKNLQRFDSIDSLLDDCLK